jgi:pimeloyl-ACP methyl ester carboxylesterase
MRLSRPLLLGSLIATLITSGPAVGSASALSFGACGNDAPSFKCATLRLPLDRSGAMAGSVGIRVAAQRRFPAGAKLLVAMAGGPGQGAVNFASQFESTLDPLLSRYRLVVIDQRGTGASGALSCPELQFGTVEWGSKAVRDCALRVGPRRQFYSTADTVADLDAVRAAFHAPKLALMGVSYGTWVAQEYARTYPSKTDSLILDSVVGPDRPNPFYLETLSALPRVVEGLCAGGRCAGITSDPLGDVEAVVHRVGAAPLKGRVYDSRGVGHAASYQDQNELLSVLLASDLNGPLQAQLPASFAAAKRGDYAQLLRLAAVSMSVGGPTQEYSEALNAITNCLDSALPYGLSSAPASRAARISSALGAVSAAAYAPFSTSSVRSGSAASDCELFPPQVDHPQVSGGLPDVPALILSGSLDLRTPVEGARAVAAQLPHASLIELRGAGHDVLDTDFTGCAERAVERFAARRSGSSPCAGLNVAADPAQIAPRRLVEVIGVTGLTGDRGRAVGAALATIEDAIAASDVRYEAGFSGLRGGGLRGGAYDMKARSGGLHLCNYRLVSDLAVSGSLADTDIYQPSGVLRLSGAVDGSLTIHGWGHVTGVLDGKAVRWRAAGRKSPPRTAARRSDRPVLAFRAR